MRSSTFWQWAIVIAAVAALEVACRTGLISRLDMTPPSDMAVRLAALLRQPRYLEQIASTLYSAALAVALGCIIGFGAGVLLHRSPRARRAVQPLLVSYFALPFFVIYPLLIVFFGMNRVPIVVIATFSAAVAMLISILDGLDRVPPVLRKVGRTFHLGTLATSLHIQLPATLPYLFTGAKLAIAYAVTNVIGAEFILSGGGLGYAISFAYNNFDNATMYALLLFVIVFVVALLMLLNLVERRLRYTLTSGIMPGVQVPERGTRAQRWLDAAIVVAAILGIWQVLHLVTSAEALASPLVTAQRIAALFRSAEFFANVQETFRALLIALAISCLGGAAIGVLLAMSRAAAAVAEPMMVTLQSIPKITLYPVFLLFFGLGLAAKVAFGVIHGIVPVALVILNAVRSLNPALRRTGRALHLSGAQTVLTILVPASLAEIITAVRLGFCLSFLGVILGELFASKRGLGFMLMNGISVNDVPTMFAVTALIGGFAIVVNNLLVALETRLRA